VGYGKDTVKLPERKGWENEKGLLETPIKMYRKKSICALLCIPESNIMGIS